MDTGRVNGGGAGRRSINLGVVDRLFDYAVADPLVVRCRDMLTQAALLQNKFTVRIGASTTALPMFCSPRGAMNRSMQNSPTTPSDIHHPKFPLENSTASGMM